MPGPRTSSPVSSPEASLKKSKRVIRLHTHTDAHTHTHKYKVCVCVRIRLHNCCRHYKVQDDSKDLVGAIGLLQMFS
jgi:hypothetical protein